MLFLYFLGGLNRTMLSILQQTILCNERKPLCDNPEVHFNQPH